MKSILFIPLSDYFKSRKQVWRKFTFPFVVGIISLVAALILDVGAKDKIIHLFSEFIGTQINIVAILVSFSVAIISILVSADNENIRRLKETESDKGSYKPINGKQLSLFQILLSNIAYNVIVEIAYLTLLIFISIAQSVLPICWLKYVTSVCIIVIVHILLVLMESVAQMYLTFWKYK